MKRELDHSVNVVKDKKWGQMTRQPEITLGMMSPILLGGRMQEWVTKVLVGAVLACGGIIWTQHERSVRNEQRIQFLEQHIQDCQRYQRDYGEFNSQDPDRAPVS